MDRTATARIVRAWLERLAANVDLTWDQALEMLGFAAGSSPSKDEIQRAYRTMARRYHPDLGGDAEKMVEVNAAKDILDGTRRPASGYGRYTPPKPQYEPPRYEQEPPRYHYNERTKTVVSFAEALHDVSIPAGVKWVFCTERLRSSRDYSADESSRYTSAYIALGQTETQMVLMLMHHLSRQAYYIGGSDSDTWEITIQTSSLKKGALDPATVVKGVKALMVQAEVDKPANPTVIALDEKWVPSEKSLPGYAKGKRMSEFFVDLGLKKAPAAKAGPPPKMKIEVGVKYSWGEDAEKVWLFVGTREYVVDWTRVPNKRTLGYIRNMLIKNNYETKGIFRKELSRMKDKKSLAKILMLLIDHNYFDVKPPQEVQDAITAIRDAA